MRTFLIFVFAMFGYTLLEMQIQDQQKRIDALEQYVSALHDRACIR